MSTIEGSDAMPAPAATAVVIAAVAGAVVGDVVITIAAFPAPDTAPGTAAAIFPLPFLGLQTEFVFFVFFSPWEEMLLSSSPH